MTGVQRYAYETLRAIDQLLAAEPSSLSLAIEVLAPPGTPVPELSHVRFRHVGTRQGHAWEQIDLLAASRGHHLLSFGPTGPLLKGDQTVTMHDATVRAAPQAYSWKFRAFYGISLPILARRAKRVMSVSEFSRREVCRYFGANPHTTLVSGEGWQHAQRFASDASILETHGLHAKRYVLAVSSVTPHKNFAVIARAVARLGDAGHQVVVAGDHARSIYGDVDVGSLKQVRFVGYVSDAELRALYENAGVFVFPSMYEGFGLPPLEAMSCGCPVIASNAAAIPEVCGDAAVYFEPSDEAGLAAAIGRVMGSESERRALVAKGRERLKAHSWEAAARAVLAGLEDVLGVQASG